VFVLKSRESSQVRFEGDDPSPETQAPESRRKLAFVGAHIENAVDAPVYEALAKACDFNCCRKRFNGRFDAQPEQSIGT
jgi:hypothetical protein